MGQNKKDLEFYEEIALGFEFLAGYFLRFDGAKSLELLSMARRIRHNKGDSPYDHALDG